MCQYSIWNKGALVCSVGWFHITSRLQEADYSIVGGFLSLQGILDDFKNMDTKSWYTVDKILPITENEASLLYRLATNYFIELLFHAFNMF